MPTVNGFNTALGVLKYNFESLENYNTPDFNQTQTYVYNDYVMYNGKLYKYINLTPSAGAWDSSKWQLVILTNEIKNLFQNDNNLENDINNINNNITDIENQMISKEIIANEFSNGINYSVGDYVFYNNQLYKFISNHSAGEWNGTDVVVATLSSELKNTTNDINNLSSDLDETNNNLSDLNTEVDDLRSAFDEALSPSTGLRNLCTGIQKGKYWVAWNSGDTVTLTDNANYMAATVPLSGAEHITLNWNWDNNSFSFFADADNKRIALMRDCLYNELNYVYTVPEGAVYAYISQNITNDPALTYIDTIGVVVLDGTNVIGTEITIADYPYGGIAETSYYADDLRMSTVSDKKLSEILPSLVSLPNVVIKSTKTIYGKSGLSDFNDAPNNSLITVFIPASTAPADLPANYPVGHVIKGVGQLITYISSDSIIKIQTYRNAVQGLTYTRQYTVGTGWQTWYQPNVKKRYTCLKNGSGDFDNLVKAVQTVCEEMDAELFIGPGTWDICSEFGSTYMDNVSSDSSTWGLILKNRVHLVGSSDSVITAKYTGSHADTTEYFSAFNAGEYGFTMENLNIETDNIRYSVHDDRGTGGYEGYVNRYIDCTMKHTNGMYSDCIGGGLGRNGLIEIINCYFEGDETDTRLVYYHGNNYGGQTDAQCKLIVKGNYFAGLGTFGLTKYGDSTKVSTAYVSDNSVGSALFVNSGSYAPQDNMRMIEWNNVVRS